MAEKNPTFDALTQRIQQAAALPSGTAFTLSFSDTELSAAADEFLTMYKPSIDEMIRQYAGFSVDISDPKIRFSDGKVHAALKVGKGFLKTNADITANINWDGVNLSVLTESVKVPVFTVDTTMVDNTIKAPIDKAVLNLLQYYNINAVSITDGILSIDAVRK